MCDPYFQEPSFQVLWRAVTSDPMNFQSWTALLAQVESVVSPDDALRAYDEFLRQFPLCFAYWEKYATLARKHPLPAATLPTSSSGGGGGGGDGDGSGGEDRGQGQEEGEPSSPGARRARAVYERAVLAAPFCLELWEAFAGHVLEGIPEGEIGAGGAADQSASRAAAAAGVAGGGGGKVEDARRVLERALEAVGDNPGAGALWRRSVAFEEAQGGRDSPLRVTRLYERAFGYRLKDLEKLWVGFKDFVDRTPWEKLQPLPPPPPLTASSGAGDIEVAAAAGCEVAEAVIAVVTSADEGRGKGQGKGASGAEKKATLVKMLDEKRKVSLRGRQRRESFERRIRRPHFHVKPLDDEQLSAWSRYLDFELAQEAAGGTGAPAAAEGRTSVTSSTSNAGGGGQHAGVIGRKRPRVGDGVGGGSSGSSNKEIERLFERCLVPCACYWWLWERYALWKESVSGLESALEVADRACSPFLRWRPEALFFKAELLERSGRKDEAREVYQRVLLEVAPGLVEGACKLACFERRCGNQGAASAAYRSLLPPPLGCRLSAGTGGAELGARGTAATHHWEETTETTRPYLYLQLARFQQRVVGDAAAARATFRAAVADIPGSRELWLAFLEFEAAQPQALHTGRVEATFRMAVEEEGEGSRGGLGRTGGALGTDASSISDGGNIHRGGDDARRLTVEDRADLWEWFEEFVEDLSMDVAKVMQVRAQHQTWTRTHAMDAHEAAAAVAAATVPAASIVGGDPAQASQRSSGSSPAAASRTVAPPANPRRHPRGTVGGVVAGEGGGGYGAEMWAGGAGTVSGGGDEQRDQWSVYFQQQQQQHLHQMAVLSSPAVAAAFKGAEAIGGGAAAASPVPFVATFGANPSVPPVARSGWDAAPAAAAFANGSGMATSPEQGAVGGQALRQSQQQQQQQQQQVQNQQDLYHWVYGGGYPLQPGQPPQQQGRSR